MALTVQNLRAVGPGTEPASLLPGQLAFNITDKVLFVGDGSNFKTQFDGDQVAGTPGEGWYAMPMDFASLGDYYVANPGYYGDVPTDQQVLAWSTALNHPIWITGTGGGGSQVYIVTNAQVASASGATTSDKITAAIGVASPDEGNVAIVTGLPDDVYEGLYFFTTEWVKGAAYAYPSASEVIYNNVAHPTLGATVQAAIDDLDDGLIATTAIANTANSTANSALSIASAALPRAGGTMTGTIVAQNINVQSGFGVQFNAGAAGTINGINDSINATSSTVAASGTAVKAAYDIGAAALARSGGTMTGTITFAAGQIFPVSGIQDATTGQKGIVQIGTNIQVASGVISVGTATVSSTGIVQLNDTVSSTSITQAATARVAKDLQDQIDSLTLASNVTLAGSLNATTGLLDSVTTLGSGAGFVAGSALPAASAGNVDYYVLTTVGGSYNPPGGGGPYNAENGDWFLSNGTSWQYLGVGARPQSASYTTAGIVQLADTAVTYTGTSDTEAVTPNSLQDKLSDSTSLADSNRIASSAALKTTFDVAAAAIPCSAVTGKGAIVTGSAAGTPVALPVGTNGQVLLANSACAAGLEWANDTPGDVSSVSATSPVTANNTDPQNPVIGINAASTTQSGAVQLNDTVTSTLTTEAATANAAKVAYDEAVIACGIAQAAIPCASFTVPGELLAGTGAGTYSALPVGIDGQFLSANSVCGTGLEWCTLSIACVPCSAYTAVGTILAGNGPGTYCSLAVGTNGQILIADSACASGIKWTENLIGITTATNTALGTGAGDSITTGLNNVSIGLNSGTAITSGGNNVILGANTGDTITTGVFNTLVGATAGGNIATNSEGNTAVGFGAGGVGSLAGGYNTVMGHSAGQAITSGGGNTFMGYQSGASVTTGIHNTFVGRYFGAAGMSNNVVLADGAGTVRFQANNSGAWAPNGTNFGSVGQVLTSLGTVAAPAWCTLSLACVPCAAFVACGDLLVGTGSATFTALPTGTNGQALLVDTACTATGGLKWATPPSLCGYTCTAAPLNTALGFQAGDSITTGTDNVTIGYNAGTAITNGSQNVIIGSNTSVSSNAVGIVAIGFCAGQANTTGGCVVHIGWVSGRNSTGLSNTYVGALTGCAASNTSACGTLLGFCAGSALTTGNGNTFLGHQTGRFVTTGNFNVAIGVATFQTATTGTCNVAIGCGALNGNITGSGSVAVGSRALTNTGGTAVNTAVGSEAGAQTSGTGNSYFGVNAGCAVNTGTCNTLIGRNSGTAITTGSCNTIVGSFAGSTTLANNVVLADGAGNIKLQVNESGAVGVGTTPSYGTAGQVLKSAGTAAAPAWSSALYGAFSSSATQTNAGGASGNAVTLNTTASANGFSIVSGSQITAATAGVYNIQISLQVEKTDSGTDSVEVWFKKNGADIANSNTNIELSGNGAKQLFALNLVEPLTAGQYLEVWWYSADAAVQLTAAVAGTRPAIPSAIVTVVPVGA